VSESENVEVETQGPQEERFWGLTEFVLEVFPRLSEAVAAAPWDIAQRVKYDDNIRLGDKVDVAFDLGFIHGLQYVMEQLNMRLVATDFLNKPENIRQLATQYNRLLEVFEGYKRGNVNNPFELLWITVDVRDKLIAFVEELIKNIATQK